MKEGNSATVASLKPRDVTVKTTLL